MKSLIAGILLLVFVTSSNATFTRVGGNNYSTDDSTGLDWLALSETAGQAYNNAESLNIGWRYATNFEVEGMFASLFTNFVASNSSGYAYANTYSGQHQDVITFRSLFGVSAPSIPDHYFSYGLYRDENSIVRLLGTEIWNLDRNNVVFGPQYITNYDAAADQPIKWSATYLVRSADSVPEAASIYLLTFGLLGLFGAVRRKV